MLFAARHHELATVELEHRYDPVRSKRALINPLSCLPSLHKTRPAAFP